MKTPVINFCQCVWLLTLVLLSHCCVSQVRYGISAGAHSPANGHGGFYSASFELHAGKNMLSLGPVFHALTNSPAGLRTMYVRNLSGPAPRLLAGNSEDKLHFLQLNFFTSVMYAAPLPLCPTTLKYEYALTRTYSDDYRSMKLSTLQLTGGFGLQVNFSARFRMQTLVGASLYHHLNYYSTLEHPKTAFVLSLAATVSYVIPLRKDADDGLAFENFKKL